MHGPQWLAFEQELLLGAEVDVLMSIAFDGGGFCGYQARLWRLGAEPLGCTLTLACMCRPGTPR
jgi:hypothetical protein